MFDYLVTNNKNFCPPKLYFENSSYRQVKYEVNDYNIWCKSLKEESLYKFENDDIFVLLLGTIFWSVDHENSTNKVSLFELADDYFLQKNLKKFRGNYQIIRIIKSNNILEIINDVLGLLPCYYFIDANTAYVSNSLSSFASLNKKVNKASFYEKLLFDHTINNETYFKDVTLLDQASYLRFDNNDHLKITNYFDWYSEICSISNKKFNKHDFIDKFNRIVNRRIIRNVENTIALTGGHDGRAVLSSVLLNNVKFNTFSFGRPFSENTKIPEEIAKALKFKHNSIYLLDEFENEYYKNAIQTIWLSDGELPFTQQSTLYSFKQLSIESKTVLTGLLAGEILGPVHLLTDYINPNYYYTIYRNEKIDIKDSIKTVSHGFVKVPSDDIIKEVYQHINKRKQKLFQFINPENQHMIPLLDMVTYGFRRFYGSQMHLMRYYAENIPVFYDLDLIMMLIKTNFNNTYKNCYKGRWKRRKSRILQNSIIVNNSHELSKLKLDRGFTPYQYVNPILKPFTPIAYLSRKRKLKTGKIPADFLGKQWYNNINYKGQFIESCKISNLVNKDYIDFIKNKFENNMSFSGFEINLITQILFETKILIHT